MDFGVVKTGNHNTVFTCTTVSGYLFVNSEIIYREKKNIQATAFYKMEPNVRFEVEGESSSI